LFITVTQDLIINIITVNDTIYLSSIGQINSAQTISILNNDTINNALIQNIQIITQPYSGATATVQNNQIRYLANVNFTGIDSLLYSVCSSSGSKEICDSAWVYIYIQNQTKTLNIPNGFSPNNDGVNDKWVIRGIEDYPNNVVKIFNRWGVLIYEKTGYLNDWDGTSMFGISIGNNMLPEGTYFYILELDEESTFKGYIYLKR
jgi:gliding motility-associated-like protein